MARIIVTCNNDFVNYDNIVSITILKTDDEEDAEEKSVVTDDDYGLVAVDIMNNVHILGIYETYSQACSALDKLNEWLSREINGVFSVKGDE